MRNFSQHIHEQMTTAMLGYSKDFAADTVQSDFDVEDYNKDEMKPWEVKNAEEAERRRKSVLLWLKAAGANTGKSVTDTSIPKVPKWQSRTR
jgi:hypothetical protein